MKPEVSVVIPAFNRRLMLREAMESVLAQRDVAALELIIVDDGSTDGTWEELQDGQLGRMAGAAPINLRIMIERTAHRGPAAARNRGAALAAGDYIAFLDSDDLWMPHKLQRQLAWMRAHPEFQLCQTQERWMRGGRRVNPGLRHRKRSGDFFAASLRTCLISPSAVMLRRGLFECIGGFDERMQACEDYDLWLRILCKYPAGLVDQALVVRRAGHPDQLSATVPALDRYRIRALLKLLAEGELNAIRRAMVAQAVAEKCAIYAKGLQRRGRGADYHFYSTVEHNARAMLGCPDRFGAACWIAALRSQPLELDHDERSPG